MKRFPQIRHSKRSFSNVVFSRRGMTLLEVLVAIGGLAALMTLLMAGTGFLREASKQVKCANQLRTVNVAMRMYADEHNQMFLLYGSPDYVTWYSVLKKYGLTLADCRCPSLPPTANKGSAYVAMGKRGQADIDNSLMLRGYTSPPPAGEDWLYMLRIEKPSTYVFWADSVFPLSESSGVRAGDQSYGFRLDALKSSGPGVHLRHNGKANVGFLDGHVEALAPPGLRNVGILSGYDKEVQPTRW